MTLAELRKLRAEKLNQAKALKAAGGENLSDEDFAKIEALMGEASELQTQIEAAEKREAVLANLDTQAADLEQSAGRIVAPAAPTVSAGTTAFTSDLRENVRDDPFLGYAGPLGLGELAQEIHGAGAGAVATERLRIVAAVGSPGMEQGIQADGGILVPPGHATTIRDQMDLTANSLRTMVDNLPPLPANLESMEFPVNAETSRADGSRSGGIQGFWKSELSQMTSTKPTLKGVKYEPEELYVFAYVADKLLRSAGQLGPYLNTTSAKELTFKIDNAIFRGTGSGQPKGLLTGVANTNYVRIAKEAGQVAATIVTENLEKMYARMPAAVLARAVWLVNQDTIPALLGLTKAVGTGGTVVYLPGGNISGTPFGTIYGRPVVPVEFASTLGTEGDICLADLQSYGLMAKGGLESAMSIHLKFDFNQTAFRFIVLIDGQPWIDQVITPFQGTNKQHPFITLATRS